VLRAAAEHRGTALVEIYQNCPIFNDGAYELLKDRDEAEARVVHLVDGEPVRVGGDKFVARDDSGNLIVVAAEGADMSRVVIHDAGADDPSTAFQLSRLDDPTMAHVPLGIFRNVSRPTYDDLVRAQIDDSVSKAGGQATDHDMATLLHGKDTWTVGG
jgi:2-oxoglutarate ferredoxin oxidoreductase subunit beta